MNATIFSKVCTAARWCWKPYLLQRALSRSCRVEMKVAGLISGGKDSCFNLMKCVAEGHEIVALANLRPKDKDAGETDSYMYQTVGHEMIDALAEAMGLPLYRRALSGSSLITCKDYQPQQGDEVEDLYELLREVKISSQIEAVSVGAILSDYQRVRVENVCARLGLTCLSYLWCRDQDELLKEMIECKVNAVLIKVACMGLEEKHLGQSLAQLSDHLHSLHDKFGAHVCGEGGEFETLVLDSPLHNSHIIIDESEIVHHTACDIAPVSYLVVKKFHLEEKPEQFRSLPVKDRIAALPMQTSQTFTCEYMKTIPQSPAIPYLRPDLQYGGGAWPVEYKHFIHSTGDKLFCSLAANNTGDLATDTQQMMDKLGEILTSHQMDCSNICYALLYVKDMGQFAQINAVYTKFFGINPPPRICVEAVLPDSSLLHAQIFCTKEQKTTHHVQSVSHWAPSCIGPYSQAAKVGEYLFVSGQIPFIPGVMTAIPCGFEGQCHLAFGHVMTVATVMSVGVECMAAAVVYVSREEDISSALDIASKLTPENVQPVCVLVPRLPRDVMVEWHVTFNTEKKILHTTSAGGETIPECVDRLAVKEGEYFIFYNATNINIGDLMQAMKARHPGCIFIPIPVGGVSLCPTDMKERISLVCIRIAGP